MSDALSSGQPRFLMPAGNDTFAIWRISFPPVASCSSVLVLWNAVEPAWVIWLKASGCLLSLYFKLSPSVFPFEHEGISPTDFGIDSFVDVAPLKMSLPKKALPLFALKPSPLLGCWLWAPLLLPAVESLIESKRRRRSMKEGDGFLVRYRDSLCIDGLAEYTDFRSSSN